MVKRRANHDSKGLVSECSDLNDSLVAISVMENKKVRIVLKKFNKISK